MEKAFEFACASFLYDEGGFEYERLLHRAELEKIRGACQKRKAEFLFGRLCAKYAYAKLCGKKVCFKNLCIINDCAGAPFFEEGGTFVSIAHDDGLAAAVVCDKTRLKAGLDVQKISPRAAGAIYKTLSDAEKACFASFEKEYGGDFAAAAVWAAKEALSKLFGYGFSVFSALEVSEIDNDGGIKVRFKNLGGFSILLRRHRDYLFAFAAKSRDVEMFNEKNLAITETPISEMLQKEKA